MNLSPRRIRDFWLLLLWGAFVLWMALSHQLSTYLHPSLQPYTVAAGVLLIILALFSLLDLMAKKSGGAACAHDHACCQGHDHQDEAEATDDDHQESHHHGETSSGFFSLTFRTLLLLLPLFIVLFGRGNHYTISTVQNRGVVQDLSKLPAANKSSTPTEASSGQTLGTTSASMPVQVIDLLYAVQMPTYREDFEGKQVELTGQFIPLSTGNPKGDRFQAIRLFITCCAADAKPVGVTVQYDKPLNVSEMGWVKITGIPTFPMEGGRRTAVLVANKVEECPAPAEPFVY